LNAASRFPAPHNQYETIFMTRPQDESLYDFNDPRTGVPMTTLTNHNPAAFQEQLDYLTDDQIAPCLVEGPLAEVSRAFVEAARDLGTARWASVFRAMCVPYVFSGMESIFAGHGDPVPDVNEMLGDITAFLRSATHRRFPGKLSLQGAEGPPELSEADVEAITGNHYGNLFKDFSKQAFWEEPAGLLQTRLERNGIDVGEIQGKEVLDAGCGGGRYTYAWKGLGASRAVGIDVSPLGLETARRQGEQAGIVGVEFREGNVLDIPFDDDSFDIVYSNGILHHTVDWRRGIAELVRVLKPSGWGWLYVIEDPGGLMWDLVEILRVAMKGESRDLARRVLQMLGIPQNRVFYMLDHVMVPINIRLKPEDVAETLRQNGASDVRRLTRGTDFDRIEQIYQQVPFATCKYGVGENRFVFRKS
jgi:ubiquinone/menaquinone biosynthesis C-methylase UbiE